MPSTTPGAKLMMKLIDAPFLVLALALLTVALRITDAQVQIIGTEVAECGLSASIYQVKPVLVACMAPNPPFLVQRTLYSPGGGGSCPAEDVTPAGTAWSNSFPSSASFLKDDGDHAKKYADIQVRYVALLIAQAPLDH